jgi:hypothetical protein
MDKNTILGLLLMGVVIFGFSMLNSGDDQSNQPTTEKTEKADAKQATTDIADSLNANELARTFSLGDQVFQLITMPFYLHQRRTTELGAGRNEERRSVRKRVNIHQQLSGSTFQATFDIHGVCIIIHTRSRIVNIYIHVRINAETRHKGKTTSQRQIRRNRSSDLHIYTRQTNTHSCRNRIENP